MKPGSKYDDGKDRWDLVPWDIWTEEVRVLGHGAQKYGDNNWRDVLNGVDRYFAAALRHLIAWRQGEDLDPESGLSHLAHARCSLAFAWFHQQQQPKEDE